MENCVIYARFSSHGQNEQSIEAQVRICKEYAESKGLDVKARAWMSSIFTPIKPERELTTPVRLFRR